MKVLVAGVGAATLGILEKALSCRKHELIAVQNGVEALEVIRTASPPLVVAEDPLPDMTGSDFCRRARASPQGANAVILVIAHRDDEYNAVLESGATDLYVTSLGPSALEIRLLIAERLVAEHARLRDREARFRRLFDSGVTGVTIADKDGNFKEANDSFLRMLGYTRDEMHAGLLNWKVITPLDLVVPDIEAREQLRATGFLPLRERAFVHKDGHHVAVLVGAAALDGTGECISYVTDISERKQAEEAVRASEAQYRALFNSSPVPKWLCDVETSRFLAVNDIAVTQYGYSRDEFLRMTVEEICPPEDIPPPAHEATTAVAGPLYRGVRKHVKKGGASIDADETVHTLMFQGRLCRLVVAQDVTERRRAQEALRTSEELLRQAQKMDSIGRLAGGVAHDFNNLLSVILSYSEMLATDLKPGDPMRADLEEIRGAGLHAANLTRQLLAFGRQQILRPVVLDPNAIVAGLENLLRRVIGEDVQLTVIAQEGLGKVIADPGQIEQIMMNLVVNARDAMPNGGKLTIETSNVDAARASEISGLQAAPYVLLTVTDTGVGMDGVTCEHIFEPFFTTKEQGKGTGLGLSTVFGIVQQSGGHVWVRSEPGEGTTFKIYLPRANADADAVPSRRVAEERAAPRGLETILLVEDEERVRTLAHTILHRQGYHVIEAQNAGEALLVCEQHGATIHLLLTDVVMPRMSGLQLAERLQTLRPAMKVLYMSGYTDDPLLCHGITDSEIAFLQKPITPDLLARKVRDVLDAPRKANASRPQEGGAASATMRLSAWAPQPAVRRH